MFNKSERVNLIQRVKYPFTFAELKKRFGGDVSAVAVYLFQWLVDYLENDTCGKVGKAYELTIRSILANRLIETLVINRHYDLKSKFLGEYYGLGRDAIVEVKHACCILPDTRGLDFVIYVPEVDETTNAIEQAYVFSVDDWESMLNGYDGRGQLTKANSRDASLRNIQSFRSETRPKASKPIAEYLWNTCYDMETLADILNA